MSKNVTARQLKAIYMLIEGKTGGEIAARLHLRRETLSRWKRLPHFQQKLEQVMADLEQSLERRFGRLAEAAVEAIGAGLSYQKFDSKRVDMALKVMERLGIAHESTPKVTKRADNAKKATEITSTPVS